MIHVLHEWNTYSNVLFIAIQIDTVRREYTENLPSFFIKLNYSVF